MMLSLSPQLSSHSGSGAMIFLQALAAATMAVAARTDYVVIAVIVIVIFVIVIVVVIVVIVVGDGCWGSGVNCGNSIYGTIVVNGFCLAKTAGRPGSQNRQRLDKQARHFGSEEPVALASSHSLSHDLGSERASE